MDEHVEALLSRPGTGTPLSLKHADIPGEPPDRARFSEKRDDKIASTGWIVVDHALSWWNWCSI
jgi:hypothetical protein